MDEKNEKASELVDEQVQQDNMRDRMVQEYMFDRQRMEQLGEWLNSIFTGETVNDTGIPTEVYAAKYHGLCNLIAINELIMGIMGLIGENENVEPEATD